MTVNTANKQRSVFGLDGPAFVIFPAPDNASFDEADRRHLVGLYRFEDVVEPGVVTVAFAAVTTLTVSET